MNKKLIFKILGIAGGSIIIISLFLPYIKDAGSLWQIYLNNKQVYLAIVIILFGLLPVVLFSIDKKIEYTYMSVGALLFYIISQAINTLSTGTFNTLSIGFYIMLIGTVLVTLVTFITNKDSKVKTFDEQIAPISNNLSNPLDRNGLEVPISPNPSVEKTDSFINNDDSKSELDDDNSDDALGEEIPDYQPEDGVNPVLAEFTPEVSPSEESTSSDATLGSESLDNKETNVEETNPVPANNSETLSQEQPNISVESSKETPVEEQKPEVKSNDNQVLDTNNENQQPPLPTLESTPSVDQTPTTESQSTSILPQPEISFDDTPQEIPENPEPQFDIFGQPK